jgi:hypothetical protein
MTLINQNRKLLFDKVAQHSLILSEDRLAPIMYMFGTDVQDRYHLVPEVLAFALSKLSDSKISRAKMFLIAWHDSDKTLRTYKSKLAEVLSKPVDQLSKDDYQYVARIAAQIYRTRTKSFDWY